MQELAQKRRVRSILYSPITAIILIILILIVTKGTWNLYQKSKEAKAGRLQVEREIKEISNREVYLKAELAALETKRGIEQKIRGKFNVKKEGEEVAIITRASEEEDVVGTLGRTWFNNFIVRIVDFFQ